MYVCRIYLYALLLSFTIVTNVDANVEIIKLYVDSQRSIADFDPEVHIINEVAELQYKSSRSALAR